MNAPEARSAQVLRDSLIARARNLVPDLRARSAETCANRRVPAASACALRDSGLTRVLQPARFGGYAADYRLFTDIIQELAQGCASTSWIYGVFGEHQWVIANFSEQAQAEVWADPTAVACASFVPQGHAVALEGGWRVSGSWSFASGCDHAQWAIIGALVEKAPGQRVSRDFIIGMHELAIKDDWHVLGLQGTGSKSLVVDQVFVPDHLVLGEVGKGWNVAMATAGSERGLSLRSPARYTEAANRLVDLYAERFTGDPDRTRRSADAVAAAWMDAEAYRLNTLWTATRVLEGGAVGPEASANKIHWSQTDLAIHRAALDLLGPTAEFHGDGIDAPWLDGYLFALAGPIYAGTNEIQRNVVAERMLGLPRA